MGGEFTQSNQNGIPLVLTRGHMDRRLNRPCFHLPGRPILGIGFCLLPGLMQGLVFDSMYQGSSLSTIFLTHGHMPKAHCMNPHMYPW